MSRLYLAACFLTGYTLGALAHAITRPREGGTMPTTLTAEDRCDRCPAAASVVVDMTSGSVLMFCTHHFREVEDALAADVAVLGVTVVSTS